MDNGRLELVNEVTDCESNEVTPDELDARSIEDESEEHNDNIESENGCEYNPHLDRTISEDTVLVSKKSTKKFTNRSVPARTRRMTRSGTCYLHHHHILNYMVTPKKLKNLIESIHNNKYVMPNNFFSAWFHRDNQEQVKWIKAITEEAMEITNKQVWKEIPDDKIVQKAIGLKWVMTVKNDGRYRACLVSLG